MSKVLVWVSVLLVVIFGGRALVQHMSRTSQETAATSRVKGFLAGMSAGGDFQNAFDMWMTGGTGAIGEMTQDQYNLEQGRLQAWVASRRLGNGVSSYEVRGATVIAPAEGAEFAVVDVACVINGQAATIRAVKNQRLEWVD